MGAAGENGYARSCIFHVKREFVSGVCGIQRCGDSAGSGYGEECGNEFVSVDEDDRYGDARFDAVRGQDVCEALDLGVEIVV